ncbi:MAG TPA: site-2 protease family protein [Verrucomicrobiae bacterium]|nr:site-2 protease family protein [Verrucomicrobiae bacterium]
MKWSVRLVRIAGIDLKIHVTFLMFLAWIAFTYYQQGGREVAIQGTLFVALLFLCVLLHELGHALTARSFGIRTPDITLLPIGGVARLERIPEEPKQELLIAIAGPLVNVAIAAVLIFALKAEATFSDLADLNTPRVALLAKLASVNLFLVLFNLIPAFPMDGGRVLRALLAMKMNYARATHVAATVGQGLAFVFGLIGLLYSPMLLFIALFVYLGATQEAAMAQLKDISSGMTVFEAMLIEPKTLPATATLEEAAEAVLRTTQRTFVVLDEDDRVAGILTRNEIISAFHQRGGATRVNQVMHRDVPAVRTEDRLDDALSRLQAAGYPALPVVDDSGGLVGLITAEHLEEIMMIRSPRLREARPRAA